MNQPDIDRKLRELDDFLCSDNVPETAMDIATFEGFFYRPGDRPGCNHAIAYLPWV